MRMLTGNIVILLCAGIFSFVFMETIHELSSTQTLHEVLDESIQLENISLSNNSKILDKNGDTIYDVFAAENRIELAYDEIPSKVIKAFIAAEDQKFFEHPGFDMSGITRAFFVNLQSGAVEQGGSTITQQLARNLYLSHSQTYERKLSELLYAYHLERELSKEQIIEAYVNTVYFANGVYGIEAASQYYFNLNAEQLSIAQVAFLSSIPNNPSHYNPINYQDQTHERKEWILTKMYENEFINEEEYKEALEEAITTQAFEKKDDFPDYVTYVFHELEQIISKEEEYSQLIRGTSSEDEQADIQNKLKQRVDELLAMGITIETALDPAIQTHAVSTINEKLQNTSTQAATSIIDHHNAEIVALTGGISYDKFDYHRGFQAYRQPGSAIKPLLVYAPLLEEMELSSHSIIDASPINRNGYEPQNFGGAVYEKVTLEEAFKQSYNTAAVRALDIVGIETAYSFIHQFDFARLSSSDYVLPAALGGLTNGMTVNELTQAYTSFAADGMYQSPTAIRQVLNADGQIIYSPAKPTREVWSSSTVNLTRDMLAKVIEEGTGQAAQLNRSGYTGGKTGTTNKFYDLWFIGLDDQYTTGLWIGKDKPESLYRESRQNLHTGLWSDIMNGIE